MSESAEVLAIIEDVNCGMRDCGRPVLWFTAKIINGHVLQVLPWDVGAELIQASGVHCLSGLNGKGVVLSVKDAIYKYDRFAD